MRSPFCWGLISGIFLTENLHEDHPVFGHHAPLNEDKMLGQADLSCFKRKFFLSLVTDLPGTSVRRAANPLLIFPGGG